MSSVIDIDTLIVPEHGTLIFSIPSDTFDSDLERIRVELATFFQGRKVGVIRGGDVKIGCILFEDERATISTEGASWAMEGVHESI